jgi:hypothetical protein
MFGVKRRILQEIEYAFLNHPAFSSKVEVHNKFPYLERIQFGCVLRNTAGSMMRMSADNYLSDLSSHVRMVRQGNYPGIAIEWARENTNDVTKYAQDEDLTSQLDPTNRLFYTANQIVSGPGDTTYANDPRQVTVTINGSEVSVDSINGKTKEVVLYSCPSAGSTIKISYWYRAIVPPGIFAIEFISDTSFTVGPIYIITDEVLFVNTTGLETEVSLVNQFVYPLTDELFLKCHNSNNKDPVIILQRGTDYSIDNDLGKITFLRPVSPNYEMLINYRYRGVGSRPGDEVQVYTFNEFQENHTAIPGVTLCMGRRAKQGDKQGIVVSEFRESQASIHGGHWEMSLSVGVISKDPKQMEQMVDQLINWLWGVRKNVLEFEGITMTRVEPTGESEETFIESTGDLYYESSVDISVMTEWQQFTPHLFTIRHMAVDFELVPDIRPVNTCPVIGYERVI